MVATPDRKRTVQQKLPGHALCQRGAACAEARCKLTPEIRAGADKQRWRVRARALLAGLLLVECAVAGTGSGKALPVHKVPLATTSAPACLGPLIVPGVPAPIVPCVSLRPSPTSKPAASPAGRRAQPAGASASRRPGRISLRSTLMVTLAAAAITGIVVYYSTTRYPRGCIPDAGGCSYPPR